MGRSCLTRLFAIIALSVPGLCQTGIVPTTTLAQETANNTSTADGFQAQTNGNEGAANVSKLPISTLLYPGATTKIYAHLMGWFGDRVHMNVGYNSSDPAQVHRQLDDMISRGISGAIVDWYAPEYRLIDASTQAIRNDAEGRSGNFTFAIMEDGRALKSCAHRHGCDVTQKLINNLNYAVQQYAGSGAYLRSNDRPVFFFFGDEFYNIDWRRVRNQVNDNPLFIFRNDGGFTHPQTAGAFAWVAPEDVSQDDPMSLQYFINFYSASTGYPDEITFGSAYKGFNDTLAAWGRHRIVTQDCGQTWMQSLAESGLYYSAENQLESLQLVTWNDYEEGTAIEMGIDNCVGFLPTVANGVLTWSVTGSESTVDHYSVYISSDGQNLMKLTDVPSGDHTLNIDSYNFFAGNYSLFIQAMGMATLKNQMSAAIPYTVTQPLVVTINTPLNGAMVPLLLTMSASAVDSHTINSLQIFLDGTLVGQSNSGSVNAMANVIPGAHTIMATATDMNGATASSIIAVTAINQPPVAVLTVSPNNAFPGMQISGSTAGSYDPDGGPITSQIDWGDGTITTGDTGIHAYTTSGTYTATATVTDIYGAQGMASQTIIIGSSATVR